MYNACTNVVGFSTNSTERMRITSGGNVGIGTTSPTQQLETTARFVIGNSVTGRVGTFGQNTATADTYITLQNTAGNFDLGTSSGGHYFYGIGSLPLQFYTNSTEKMRITSGGTLLVGTTTEAFAGGKLQVEGTIRAAGQFTSVLPSSNFGYFDGSGQVVASASSASSLYLDATWNTTGNPDAIFLNITNTASGASSKLLNLKVGSVSQFSVSKAGAIQTTAPTGGTAQPWKLGTVYTGTCVPSDFGSFGSWFTGTVIEIEVNGTTYKIPAIIDNYC